MKAKTKIVMSALLAGQVFGNCSAYAWSDFGHMAVAYVAYKHLSDSTRQRVNALMKFNPYYQTWKSQLRPDASQDDKDAQIFMMAATWPDVIKKDPAYTSDGPSDGNRPGGPEANKNEGFSDHLMHKYWHFYDMPFAVGKTRLPTIPKPNAVTEMAMCRKVLASKASDELKAYDLTWLLHIVGDVHQPLHCVTRVSENSPNGDNGGNDVMVNKGGKQIRLHWFWDSALGANGDSLAVMEMAKTFPPAKASAAADRNAKDWINESFNLSKTKVYVSPIRPGNGPFDITEDYQRNAVAVAKERVELAGERLANILNKELK